LAKRWLALSLALCAAMAATCVAIVDPDENELNSLTAK
jgi:hypothetical protein